MDTQQEHSLLRLLVAAGPWKTQRQLAFTSQAACMTTMDEVREVKQALAQGATFSPSAGELALGRLQG